MSATIVNLTKMPSLTELLRVLQVELITLNKYKYSDVKCYVD